MYLLCPQGVVLWELLNDSLIAFPGDEMLLALRAQVSNESDRILKAGMHAAFINDCQAATAKPNLQTVQVALESMHRLGGSPIQTEAIPFAFELAQKLTICLCELFPEARSKDTELTAKVGSELAEGLLAAIKDTRLGNFLLPEEKDLVDVITVINLFHEFEAQNGDMEKLKIDDTWDASLVAVNLSDVNAFRRALARLQEALPQESPTLKKFSGIQKLIKVEIEKALTDNATISLGV